MTINNQKNKRHLDSLKTPLEKTRYMAGGNVTVARISTVDEERKTIVHKYCPKVRGLCICTGEGERLFDTPAEAKQVGQAIMAEWKKGLEDK